MKRLLVLASVLSALVLGAPAANADPVYCDGVNPNALIEFLVVDDAAACGTIPNPGWVEQIPCTYVGVWGGHYRLMFHPWYGAHHEWCGY